MLRRYSHLRLFWTSMRQYYKIWARNYNASLELRKTYVKYWFFRMQKITFKTDQNQNSFNFSEDHNDITHRFRQFI